MNFSRFLLAALLALACLAPGLVSPALAARRLPGHLPRLAVAHAQSAGRVAAAETVSVALALPLRDPDGLRRLITRLHTPGDPQFGQYLTPPQFAARFSPTPADYTAVADWAKRQGLTITATHPGRLLLEVEGPSSAVEAAFAVRLLRYRSRSGRLFRAPDTGPRVPAALQGRLTEVLGLDTATVRRPHLAEFTPSIMARTIGTGFSGGLSPADVQTAYGLSGSSATGAGQAIALFQLDGFRAGDIAAYQNAYGLPAVPVQTILVAGASGFAGANSNEVTLDIELALSLAPGLSRVLVYESVNTTPGVLGCYQRIADDNLAKQVSTSWGSPEDPDYQADMDTEYRIFQQMAAQGQSMFAASGDAGAYDNGSTLTVDDPASQPYVTGIGGTTLTTASPGGPYQSETTWGDFSNFSGGGGGVSQIWATPDYQFSTLSSPPGMRGVPDISLNSNPQTGYSIYYRGAWHVYGGTSAAAPLYASFAALVNEQRATQGAAPVGFFNPALYALAAGTHASADFHDIADGSSNLYYRAAPGYDLATGLGTPTGVSLLNDLVAYGRPNVPAAPASPSHVLWGRTDGQISLWNQDGGTGAFAEHSFGPYPGWTARALADGPDGLTRLLWTSSDGTMSLWRLNAASGSYTQQAFGPYPGWTASAVSVGADTQAHILWSSTDGTLSLWRLDSASGSFSQNTYGPYPGWTARSISTDKSNITHVLWTNTDGRLSVWNQDGGTGAFAEHSFGPYPGWTACALADGPDGLTRVLLVNTSGTMSLWRLNAAAGTFTQTAYGPYSGWAASAVSVGADNQTHILWNNTDGRLSLWNTAPDGTFSQNTYGPYGGWAATALSSP